MNGRTGNTGLVKDREDKSMRRTGRINATPALAADYEFLLYALQQAVATISAIFSLINQLITFFQTHFECC